MARVHTRKARKDYPAQGIKKGDTYYTWKTRTTVGKSYVGRVHRSLQRPLTTSSSAWEQTQAEINKSFEGADSADSLREIASVIRDAGEEERSKFDNMPEGLQQGDTGQMLEERADNSEQWAGRVEEIADELENKLSEIDGEEEEARPIAAAWDDYNAAVEAWDEDSGEPEPEEPEDEDPRDRDYESERNEAIQDAVTEAQGECPF